MKKWIGIGAVTTVAACLLFWSYGNQPSARPPRGKPAARAGAEAREERQSAPLAAEGARRTGAPAAPQGARAPAEEEARAPASPAKTSEVPQVPASEVPRFLDAQFDAEPVDPGWARDTTGLVQDTVSSSLPASGSLLSVECRSSMCRFEVQLDSTQAGEELIEDLFVLPRRKLDLGPAIFPRRVTGPEGETKLLVFVARENGRLPVMDVIQDDPGAG